MTKRISAVTVPALRARITSINTMKSKQNGRHFVDDTFKLIFLNKIKSTFIQISQKYVPKSSINNNLVSIQIMASRRIGDTPLIESMVA